MKQDTVDILLATYNGEKFLNSLLESLKNQSIKDWRLLVRDDGSSDNTMPILKKFQNTWKNPKKVIIFKDQAGNLGVVQNFAYLLNQSKADYIMLCDQDDIWKKKKIEYSITKIKKLEEEVGKIPILIHTDLSVINEKQEIIAKSFWTMQKLNPKISLNLTQLLLHNVITGCTIAINRPAVILTKNIPQTALMHDYWMGVIISKYGKIDYIPTQTIFYRKHQFNQIGPKALDFFYMIDKIRSFFIDFKKYLIMLQYLPFHAPLGKAFLNKMIISFQRMLFPQRFFIFSH